MKETISGDQLSNLFIDLVNATENGQEQEVKAILQRINGSQEIYEFYHHIREELADYIPQPLSEIQSSMIKVIYSFETFKQFIIEYLLYYQFEPSDHYLDEARWWRDALGDLWKCNNCIVRTVCINWCEGFETPDAD
jgi:hypothetical protein